MQSLFANYGDFWLQANFYFVQVTQSNILPIYLSYLTALLNTLRSEPFKAKPSCKGRTSSWALNQKMICINAKIALGIQ